MRKLATIQKITKLTPIKGKDRIEVATILDWEVIVQKEQFKVDDLVVYCEYDTILPQVPEFEFLRARCFSPKWNGFRIRNMKMAGVFSSGIVFPLDILPKKIKIKENVDVTNVLGVVKYDPEKRMELPSKKRSKLVKWLLKDPFLRAIYMKLFLTKTKGQDYPADISKANEVNIQNIFSIIKREFPDELFYKTEKIEGQAATYEYRRDAKKPWYKFFAKEESFKVYSHNIQKKVVDNSNWWSIAKEYSMWAKLKKVGFNVAIQGEIVGPGIQKNIYSLTRLKFYVYRVKNLDTGKYLEFAELIQFCADNFLTTVPILQVGVQLPETVKEIIEDSNGTTLCSEGDRSQKREGVVWRSVRDQRVGFKARSPKYLIWWDGKE